MNTDDINQWVKRVMKIELTPDQLRCMDTLCSIAAPWNLPLVVVGLDNKPSIEVRGRWVRAVLTCDLATFDGDSLTRLVKAAHRNLVRVDISSTICFSKRRGVDDHVTFIPDAHDRARFVEGGWWPTNALEIYLHHRAASGPYKWSWHPGMEALA